MGKNKLDFEIWLEAEYCMTYDEYQNADKRERSSIKSAYEEYLAE